METKSALHNWFNNVKSQLPKSVLIVKDTVTGQYFSLNDDAEIIAQILRLEINRESCGSICVIPSEDEKKFVPILLKKNIKVAIVHQESGGSFCYQSFNHDSRRS